MNEEQYQAVSADPGPALVLAGAGSGKTRTLTYRVAYLLSKGVRPDEILLLTFTNKAAREMLNRVHDLSGIPGHRFWGGTFHHIGHRILRMYGEKVGLKRQFTILDQGDAESIMSEAVKERDPAFFKNKQNPKAKVLGSVWSMVRNTREGIGETVEAHFNHLWDKVGKMEQFFAAYTLRKHELQVVDYDDLLELFLALLDNHEEIRTALQNRWRHVLVDEYQDTNTLQSEIIDRIGSHHRIMAVGDDSQCIYSWRGANFENIVTFPERHPATAVHKIETNYRSTPQILGLANQIFPPRAGNDLFAKELRACREDGEKPFLIQTLDTQEQAHFVIARINALLEEGRNLSDIAVLYRAHFQALDLQLELSKRGIPYQITSGVRFFEQAHIRDLIGHLKFVYNPADTTAFQRICSLLPKIGPKSSQKLHGLMIKLARERGQSPVRVMDDETILKKVPAAAKSDWPSFALSMKQIEKAMNEFTPQDMVQTTIDGWYGDYLQGAYADYQKRMDDLNSFVGFAARYGEIQEMLGQLVLLNGEATDKSPDEEEEKLRLTTVHQAKGLEFPVVFVIGLADGFFPLRRAIEEGDVDEERRLFYVAVTRAMDELYLSAPMMSRAGPGGSMSLRPSQFLGEVGEECFQKLRLTRSRRW